MADAFYGEIRALPYTYAPFEWAFCNGQLMEISQNTALFSILGTTYGGDGSNTFALPNLKGRTPMHPGRGPGLTQRVLGEPLGSTSVVLKDSQIPTHTHVANAATKTTPESDMPTSTSLPHKLGIDEASYADYVYTDKSDNLVPMNQSTISTIGQSLEHENRQPFLGVNFCISLYGLYPSRS